ncbi:MAG: nitrogenase component 1 [Coriobacteriales bacterium]
MKRIAVYGKGGIGKSTISANLSAALAEQGARVLQIGCDPKHDSTRLLLHGVQPVTALDYMRVTGPLDYRLSDILQTGYLGVGCIEAGGPKPGVGCAGRGIISTFEMLERFDLDSRYDITIYDVLGDVVCGGFAVPIRREYADTILVVTSGEFMSIYAANNILRGIANYDTDGRKRVAGIVYNSRDVAGEDERVRKFAEAVDLPVFTQIPRSDAFARAERDNMTLMERGSDPEISELFRDMAKRLLGGCELHPAKPLEDDELERVVLGDPEADRMGRRGAGVAGEQAADRGASPQYAASANLAESDAPVDLSNPNRYLSKNVIRNEPLHGCAFNGALNTCIHVTDAIVLAHSPKSCTYISYQTIGSVGRRRLFERGSLLPVSLSPNLECTEMGSSEIVFGGMEKLESKIEELENLNPPAIIVISACPSGIIGDDIDSTSGLSTEKTKVIPIRTDGNMSGDFLQGELMCYTRLARDLVDPNAPKVPRTVNVIAEKVCVTGTQQNFETIQEFLNRMDVRVNCRFIYDTTVEKIRNFCSAELTLPSYSDYTAKMVGDFFHDEFGCEIFDMGFPVGFDATCTWLRRLGKRFDRSEVAERIISEQQESYRRQIDELKPALEGKKLMVITFNSELDWILKTALDLGMEISKICALDYSQDIGFRSNLGIDLPVELDYDPSNRASDLARISPDILLTNYASSVSEDVPVSDTIPMCPEVGFDSAITLARRWAKLMASNLKGDWQQDEPLFDKYYSR